MNELSRTIQAALIQEYRDRATELHRWADPLSEEQFWKNPFGYGNSVGHLVLHLTGNLSYYIGSQIVRTGYVRNRDREFTDTSQPSKADVLSRFDQAIEMVLSALETQNDSDWTLAYSGEREVHARDRFTIFLRCASHLYMHVGQINYLSRQLTQG